ncbi:hypothetical protein FPRO04_02101 [Fusarium proliferatum]|nr:hypothetical protein FPRO03_05472 [Fusarium proliferatum]KAG4272044.1 hypothetical protein FPRO04_02101 [Fusarium proliferatum]
MKHLYGLSCIGLLGLAALTTGKDVSYVTDLEIFTYLGSSRCPEAAELNAPCVCNKKDVVRDITSTLRSAVKYSCSNNGDVTSAQNFYSEFCRMNDGTTSFAPPKGPPGDMSYYITAMPHFKSLNKCAQSGIASAVMESYPTASSGAGPKTTGPGMTGSAGATATSSSNTANQSDPDHEDKEEDESKTSIAPIAGGVAGAIVVAALGAGLFLCIRRKRQRQAKGEELSNNADGPPEYTGHPELMGNSAYIKGHTAPPIVSELSSTTSFKPELGGGQGISELPPNHAPTAELQAHLAKSNWGHSPAQSEYVSPVSPAPAYSGLHGMGFQSGPVEAYELDSNIRSR